MLRSIEKDFDIAYHKRAIQRCLEDIRDHAEALVDVDYDPYTILHEASVLCQHLRDEFTGI